MTRYEERALKSGSELLTSVPTRSSRLQRERNLVLVLEVSTPDGPSVHSKVDYQAKGERSVEVLLGFCKTRGLKEGERDEAD